MSFPSFAMPSSEEPFETSETRRGSSQVIPVAEPSKTYLDVKFPTELRITPPEESKLEELSRKLTVLTTALTVTTLPVILEGKSRVMPLVNADDLSELRDQISGYEILSPRNKELVETLTEMGIPFYSGRTGYLLHEFRSNYEIYLIKLKDGSGVVTYGRIENGEFRLD